MKQLIEKSPPPLFPAEIWLHLFSQLIPEHLSAFALVNIYLKRLSRQNEIWEKKFLKHFPGDHCNYVNKPQINWYTAFAKCYVSNYKNNALSFFFEIRDSIDKPHIKKMFSLVKESALYELQDYQIQPYHLDISDSRNTTLLEWAQKSGNQKILDYFYKVIKVYYSELAKKFIPTNVDHQERTLLHWSVLLNQSNKVIYSLYSNGSYLRAVTHNGTEIIHFASGNSRIKLMQFLLNTYPGLLNKKNTYHLTPIFFAVNSGSLETVMFLVDKGAELDMDLGQETLLHTACMRGHLKIVQLLLQKNPGLLNQKNNANQTALWTAAYYGFTTIVEFLVSKGAKLNIAASDNHYTALHLAILKNDSNMTELLLKHNADLSIMSLLDNKYESPICMACRKGYLKIVQLLLKKKPELLNIVSKISDSPLITAAFYGHADIVEFFIEQGADLTHTYYQENYKDYTALHMAALNNNVQTVKVLLNTNTPLSTFTTYWGKTADEVTNHHLIKNLIRLDRFIRYSEGTVIKENISFFRKKSNLSLDTPAILDAAVVLKAVLLGHMQPFMLQQYEYELNTTNLKPIFNDLLLYIPANLASIFFLSSTS